MSFHLIDLENWARKDCKNNYRLYPTFTWIVTNTLNQHTEFKMSFDSNNHLGYYDEISPCYSVLNDETKIMDSLCTPYHRDFKCFYNTMVTDLNASYPSNSSCCSRWVSLFTFLY